MIIPNIWENKKCSKPPTRKCQIPDAVFAVLNGKALESLSSNLGLGAPPKTSPAYVILLILLTQFVSLLQLVLKKQATHTPVHAEISGRGTLRLLPTHPNLMITTPTFPDKRVSTGRDEVFFTCSTKRRNMWEPFFLNFPTILIMIITMTSSLVDVAVILVLTIAAIAITITITIIIIIIIIITIPYPYPYPCPTSIPDHTIPSSSWSSSSSPSSSSTSPAPASAPRPPQPPRPPRPPTTPAPAPAPTTTATATSTLLAYRNQFYHFFSPFASSFAQHGVIGTRTQVTKRLSKIELKCWLWVHFR